MEVIFKTFTDLTQDELYELLRLRAEVFVVEQNCPYQDIDNKDQVATHAFIKEPSSNMIAYARLFKAGYYAQEPSIGRVVTKLSHRNKGIAKVLMSACIDYMKTTLKVNTIELSAQNYILDFYKNLGFKTEGKSYLEDGIPHTRMKLKFTEF
ncbi:MAG: GNAT family N-acetyltransferase [Flavobacteriaceae bacterium]|nr:GNAT family N-acetyltransferase [Flavobacteriaceae bacterium]